MLIVVTGGSGSGKSEFAEEMAVKLAGSAFRQDGVSEGCSERAGRLVYLATMLPFGKEGRERIRRHRALREGKGFLTIEKQDTLAEIDPEKLFGATVLLEDLSNLISNEMFGKEKGEAWQPEEVIGRVLEGLLFIRQHSGNLIIVMNEIFSDGRIYEEGTERFLQVAGCLNRKIAEKADACWEVVYGIPVSLRS